jgi:hypothetical protein
MMSTTQKKRARVGLVGFLAIVLALLGVLALFVVRMIFVGAARSDLVRCKTETISLTSALNGYRAQYGEYPVGDNATVLKALRAQNPKGLLFLDIDPRSLDEHGSFIDPWRKPYFIETTPTNGISIRSAGPNRCFGDADDVTNSP